MSAFELARGYNPSILGLGSIMHTNDMVCAHIQNAAIRALQRLLRSQNRKAIGRTAINTGDEVLYYYHSTKNGPKEFRSDLSKSVHDHSVEISSNNKLPHTKGAFEDIRINPNLPLTEANTDPRKNNEPLQQL